MTRIARQFFALLLLVTAASCVTTWLTARWRSPDYTGRPHNILVLCLAPEEAQRRTLEDSFSAALVKAGVNAVPSYQVLPVGTDVTREQLSQLISQRGFDAAVVTRILDAQWVPNYAPGPYVVPYPGYGVGFYRAHPFFFYDYFAPGYPFVYSPGYWAVVRAYRIETNLYETSGQARLVWSAISESFDPPNLVTAFKDMEKLLINQLHADGIL